MFKTDPYVQYGCGLSCPEVWLNFDASPRLRLEKTLIIGSLMRYSGKTLFPERVRFGNIVRGLPLNEGSAMGVYCSHILEHLDRTSAVKALENTLRLLTPGGVFRLVVPDLSWRAKEYLENQSDDQFRAADHFMKSTCLGVEETRSGLSQGMRKLFGNSAHLWMYDYALMSHLLEEVGFVFIRRCKLGDADDPMFKLVEDEGRFYHNGHEELAIEARRPLQ